MDKGMWINGEWCYEMRQSDVPATGDSVVFTGCPPEEICINDQRVRIGKSQEAVNFIGNTVRHVEFIPIMNSYEMNQAIINLSNRIADLEIRLREIYKSEG